MSTLHGIGVDAEGMRVDEMQALNIKPKLIQYNNIL
jgi:hypothetical protein